MITELPNDARECALPGVFVTKDAKVFKAGKNGYKEIAIRSNKKTIGQFYNSAEKKYYSLLQAYAEAFVPNKDEKPFAFVKDSEKGLDPDNIIWATSDEWLEYWKANTKRLCKCCGKQMDKDMIGRLCKACFTKMANAKPDNEETKRFQERVAATGFNPEVNYFSGRQRDAIELYCSGEPIARIASILGCDLATASACIKSAKTARMLERVAGENVTPLGYKSAADVLPASMTSGADGSEKQESVTTVKTKHLHIVRANRKLVRMIEKTSAEEKLSTPISIVKSEPLSNVYTHVEKPLPVEPEEITPEWYSQAKLLENEKLPVSALSEEESPHTIIGKLAKLLKCSLKTAIACFKLARRLESGVEETPLQDEVHCVQLPVSQSKEVSSIAVPFNKPEVTVTEISAETEENSNTEEVPLIVVSFDDRFKEGEHVQTAKDAVVEDKPVSSGNELGTLFDMYKASAVTIPFSSYCKVYWLASKYTGKDSMKLTKLAIRYLNSRKLKYNAQNINDVLRAGMGVIYGR